MMLHRGDPDLTTLGMDDLTELREAIDSFTARLRLEPLRMSIIYSTLSDPTVKRALRIYRWLVLRR